MSKVRFLKSLCTLLPALALSACEESVDPPGPIDVTIHAPAQIDQGYLFWHQSDEIQQDVENISVLIGADGSLVHTWPTNLTGGGTPAYLLDDGRVLRTGILNRKDVMGAPIASTDVIQIVDVDGNVDWEFSAAALENTVFHHDMELMPNGDILVVTYERLTAEEARAIGWDPGGQKFVWADGVIQIAPDFETGGGDIVWEWSFADHLIQDKFPDAPNYGVVAEHPERIDPHFPKSYVPRNAIRQHVNSVDYNEETNQILISSFIYDEIWIVGRDGDVLFRYGNPAAYGMGTPDDRKFQKQHDANWIDAGLPGAGNILVHNNNTVMRPRRPGQQSDDESNGLGIDVEESVSNVYELSLPAGKDGRYLRDEGSAFDANVVWLWEHPDYFADFQGGARRLPNGNTLITDTTDYLVVEISPEGEIVAEYRGKTPVYKAYKYSAEYIAPLLSR